MPTSNDELARKVMRGQADALGLSLPSTMSSEEMATAIIEAQRTVEEREREAFTKAKKTPVRLRKNAFSLPGVKHQKGETVEVPIDVAKRWVAGGIAERADPFPSE